MPTRPPVHKPAQGDARSTAKAYDRDRGTSHDRGYDHTWRRFRLAFLKANPLCADCYERGEVTAAVELHHIVKLRDAPDRRLEIGRASCRERV